MRLTNIAKLDRDTQNSTYQEQMLEPAPADGPHHSNYTPELGACGLIQLRAPRSPQGLTLTCMMPSCAPHEGVKASNFLQVVRGNQPAPASGL